MAVGQGIASAGNGRVKKTTVTADNITAPVGLIEANFHFAFPPTTDHVDRAKAQLQVASRALCDATDGAVYIDKVNFGASSFSGQLADIVWYSEDTDGTASHANGDQLYGTATSLTRIAGGADPDLTKGAKGIQGLVMAHELGHAVLGLYDNYDLQRRLGAAQGIGPSIEPGVTRTSTENTLMESPLAQICADSLGPDTGGRCYDDVHCQNLNGPSFDCRQVPETQSELLVPHLFDTGYTGDGNINGFPGPRPGDTLWFQAWFSGVNDFDPAHITKRWGNHGGQEDVTSFALAEAKLDAVDAAGVGR